MMKDEIKKKIDKIIKKQIKIKRIRI